MNMKELAALFSSLGYIDVSTYLNSGNVVFSAPQRADLEATIETALQKQFNLTIRVMVKTKAELETVRDQNPFAQEVIEKDRTLFVGFLFSPLSPDLQKEIDALSSPSELIRAREEVVYTLLTRADFPKTHASKNTLGKKFKTDSTTRNWNTLNAVIERMS